MRLEDMAHQDMTPDEWCQYINELEAFFRELEEFADETKKQLEENGKNSIEIEQPGI